MPLQYVPAYLLLFYLRSGGHKPLSCFQKKLNQAVFRVCLFHTVLSICLFPNLHLSYFTALPVPSVPFQTSGKLLGYLIKQISFAALASGFPFLFSSLFRILDLFFNPMAEIR